MPKELKKKMHLIRKKIEDIKKLQKGTFGEEEYQI